MATELNYKVITVGGKILAETADIAIAKRTLMGTNERAVVARGKNVVLTWNGKGTVKAFEFLPLSLCVPSL